MIFTPAHLSGIDLQRSVAIGTFIFILIHWYYNYLPHRYVFPKGFVILRTVLIFFVTFWGWYTLVRMNFVLSLLIAAFFAFITEFDRRTSAELAKIASDDELRSMSRTAGAVFQPVGLIYGMMVGVMAASKIYGTWYFAWWISELYRLAYIFATVFLSISAIVSWVGLRVKRGKRGEP